MVGYNGHIKGQFTTGQWMSLESIYDILVIFIICPSPGLRESHKTTTQTSSSPLSSV